MNKTRVALSLCLVLLGCNDDSSDLNNVVVKPNDSISDTNVVVKPNDGISIYATHAGHYGRAFMLSSAFSSNMESTVLALGKRGPSYPFTYTSNFGAEVEVVPVEHSFSDISQTINDEYIKDKDMNLYIGVIPVTDGEVLSDSAFEKLDTISLVPEGTSILAFPEYRINNIISFAKKAKEHGVKNVKLILWDSIDRDALVNSDLQISRLEKNGVEYEFVSFNKMSYEIKDLKSGSGLISAAFYSGAIGEDALTNPIFTPSQTFDKDKDNIVLFGSYTINEPDVSYVNQVEILKKLESMPDLNQYNVIFKGHPSEISVNNWIENNSESISYFKKFPYEIWQILGGGTYNYTYDNISYNIVLPKSPSKIYSIFSTTLYGEDASKIQTILGYNKIDQSKKLTKDIHSVANGDEVEHSRWQLLTGDTTTPFNMTYEWLTE